MRILAINSTIEFQNRATIEAISRNYDCIDVLLKKHIKNTYDELSAFVKGYESQS